LILLSTGVALQRLKALFADTIESFAFWGDAKQISLMFFFGAAGFFKKIFSFERTHDPLM
jgi:hypothetical protein